MNFHRLNSRDEVRKDNKNIPIPDPEQRVNNNIDLLVVPGLIFGPTGYRIGYGGGFYDRFLTTFNKDRKSTRLNSSHVSISYAVFCLKKKTKLNNNRNMPR